MRGSSTTVRKSNLRAGCAVGTAPGRTAESSDRRSPRRSLDCPLKRNKRNSERVGKRSQKAVASNGPASVSHDLTISTASVIVMPPLLWFPSENSERINFPPPGRRFNTHTHTNGRTMPLTVQTELVYILERALKSHILSLMEEPRSVGGT